MEKRCNKCGDAAGNLCAGCKLVYYCGSAHQKEDWQYHKAFCLMSRQKAKPLIQEDTPKDECVGTFRWADNDGLPPLPAFPRSPPTLTNWNEYLSARVPTVDSVVPQFLDALSYPVSFLYCLQEAGITLRSQLQNVLVVGASERAEERLSIATNYFQDIAYYHPAVSQWKLYFTGPEISTARHSTTVRLSPSMEAEYYRGTVGELMTEHYGEFTSENTVIVGFNTGFGSGYLPLMSSWVHDLVTVLNLRLPTFFTCANDYGVRLDIGLTGGETGPGNHPRSKVHLRAPAKPVECDIDPAPAWRPRDGDGHIGVDSELFLPIRDPRL